MNPSDEPETRNDEILLSHTDDMDVDQIDVETMQELNFPFKCSSCSSEFSTYELLRTHMTLHKKVY